MSLKQDIQPYIDCEGMISPSIPQPGIPGSNNGLMYTSEYIIMLMRNDEANQDDVSYYRNKLELFCKEPGLLGRHPHGAGDQEGPDDYLGVAAALIELGTEIDEKMAMSVIKYGFKHIGIMNNVCPGKFSWSSFLGRQLQLPAAYFNAAGFPILVLNTYCAFSILLSCWRVPTNNCDARRLGWLLIQCTRKSFICRMAAKVWYKRLYNDYPTGMKGVAAQYYVPGHPFAKYWIE